MKKIILLGLVAFIALIPLSALADGDHGHGDTRERLEEAGFTPEQVEIIAEHFDELDELLEAEDHGHGHGENFWSEVGELVSDPAHWLQEFIAEIVFFFTLHLFLVDKFLHWHKGSRHDLESL